MVIFPQVILDMPEGSDRDYMEWLYREYCALMFSTAWKYFRDKADVEDIVSDGCLSLMQNIPTLRSLERNKLGVYIVSTIRNTAFNHYAKQKRTNDRTTAASNEVIQSVADTTNVERKVALEDELAYVWKAIGQLPEKEQQIMHMKYALEFPDTVIAERVGLSVNSIRKYISRARNHIKAMIYAE